MRRRILLPLSVSILLVTMSAQAETPNLNPGLWSYTNITTVQGPVSLPPHQETNQQCVTQQDLDKGIDVLEIPEDCTITRADIQRDRVDYSANCKMQGMQTQLVGHATFHGDHMKGQMSSNMDTPMGKMTMQMDYQAQRLGGC